MLFFSVGKLALEAVQDILDQSGLPAEQKNS